ncbi:S-protein homolog 6 [Linum perenne]
MSSTNHQSFFVESKVVHIRNELSMMLILHCQSRDDDLHARVLPVGSEFTWSFTFMEATLFWCDLAVQDKRIHFDAIGGEKPCSFRWVVKDGGVYGNEPICEPVYYPWDQY